MQGIPTLSNKQYLVSPLPYRAVYCVPKDSNMLYSFR